MDEILSNKNDNFALLCSVQIYNKPFPIKLRKDILEIYNRRPENINGELIRFIILDQGFYGNLWPLERRLELYRQFSIQFGISLLIEIEMPTYITDANVLNYSSYITSLITQYNWIQNWEILTIPESKDNLNTSSKTVACNFLTQICPRSKVFLLTYSEIS